MTFETKTALFRIIAKAEELHRECRCPEEDCCDDLAAWIVDEFGISSQEVDAHLESAI